MGIEKQGYVFRQSIPDGNRFVPWIFMPRYIKWEYLDPEDKPHQFRMNEPSDSDLTRRTTKWTPLIKRHVDPFKSGQVT